MGNHNQEIKHCPHTIWTDVAGEDKGPENLPLRHCNLLAHSLWLQYLPPKIYTPKFAAPYMVMGSEVEEFERHIRVWYGHGNAIPMVAFYKKR